MSESVSEEWREVPSFPVKLDASTLGRLRLEPFEVGMPHGGVRRYGGDLTFGLWDDKRFIYCLRRKTYKVARLVCEAFHGPAPAGKPYCLHRDEDARNNRPDNLYWGTQKENLNAPGFLTYCSSRTGEQNPFVKGRQVSK